MLRLGDERGTMPEAISEAPAAKSGDGAGKEPPRSRLRLSQILSSLSEGVVVLPDVPRDRARKAGEKHDPSQQISAEVAIDVLRSSEKLDIDQDGRPGPAPEILLYPGKPLRRARTNLTVGEIVDRTQHAGFGVFLALLALMSMPVPGISTVFGLGIAAGAIQMVLGFDRPWLPNWMRRHRISLATLKWLSVRLARWTSGLERFIRPRFETLTRGVFWPLCGLGVLIEGLGLALPLPIPFSNAVFALPVIVYAIALLERDGLLMVLGFALTAVEIVLAVLFSNQVIAAVQKLITWVTSIFG